MSYPENLLQEKRREEKRREEKRREEKCQGIACQLSSPYAWLLDSQLHFMVFFSAWSVFNTSDINDSFLPFLVDDSQGGLINYFYIEFGFRGPEQAHQLKVM